MMKIGTVAAWIAAAVVAAGLEAAAQGGGAPRPKAVGGDPKVRFHVRLSADGKALYFLQKEELKPADFGDFSDHYAIYRVPTDGSEEPKQVVEVGDESAWRFELSRDGKTLYFLRRMEDTNRDKKVDGDDANELWSCGADGKDPKPITKKKKQLTMYGMVEGGDLLIGMERSDTSMDVYRTAPSTGVMTKACTATSLIDFSPDGGAFLVLMVTRDTNGDDEKDVMDDPELHLFDGGEKKKLLGADVGLVNAFVLDDRVYLTSRKGGNALQGGPTRIESIPFDGGEPTQWAGVKGDGFLYGAGTPGTLIGGTPVGGGIQLFLIEAPDKRRDLLVVPAGTHSVTLSEDGTTIAYAVAANRGLYSEAASTVYTAAIAAKPADPPPAPAPAPRPVEKKPEEGGDLEGGENK